MSYATPADFLLRKSQQTVGELCSETGTAITPTALLTDANLQAALDSASGEIESALLQGGRYTVDDLDAIVANADSSLTNAKAHLVRITCDIAMALLFDRKPTYSSDDYKAAIDLADVHLERLRTGKNVFNVAANIQAGLPTYDAPSVASVVSKGLIRDRTQHYYPARFSQSG